MVKPVGFDILLFLFDTIKPKFDISDLLEPANVLNKRLYVNKRNKLLI